MLNTWAKNVNNLVNTNSKACVVLYTYLIHSSSETLNYVRNKEFIRPIFQRFITLISTNDLSFFNLLNMSYAHNPQSLLLTKRIKI